MFVFVLVFFWIQGNVFVCVVHLAPRGDHLAGRRYLCGVHHALCGNHHDGPRHLRDS